MITVRGTNMKKHLIATALLTVVQMLMTDAAANHRIAAAPERITAMFKDKQAAYAALKKAPELLVGTAV